MSDKRRLSLERVLKPLGKQFMNASRRYFFSSSAFLLGSMRRNSVSTFSPRICNAFSASSSLRVRGITSPVTLLTKASLLCLYTVGNRVGRYVDVSHVYNSITAGSATVLHAMTS